MNKLRIIGSEMVLGALIALLAIGAAAASYLSAMSGILTRPSTTLRPTKS